MTQEHRSGTRPTAGPLASGGPHDPEETGPAWSDQPQPEPDLPASDLTEGAPYGPPAEPYDSAGQAPPEPPAVPGEDDASAAFDELTEIQMALAAAEAARDEYLDDLRRTQAEFQNYRKRVMREGTVQREQGVSEVLSRLLDVVDDFELAVLAAESATEVAALHKGLEMVYGKLIGLLQSFGLEKVAEEGVPFNPEWHEAVQQVDDGYVREHPVVAEVLRPGYLLNGRVLRPAMVKVAR